MPSEVVLGLGLHWPLPFHGAYTSRFFGPSYMVSSAGCMLSIMPARDKYKEQIQLADEMRVMASISWWHPIKRLKQAMRLAVMEHEWETYWGVKFED